MRKRSLRAALICLALAAPLLPGQVAQAYPKTSAYGCGGQNTTYYFSAHPGWDRRYQQPDGSYRTARDYAIAGMNAWRIPLDYHGGRVVTHNVNTSYSGYMIHLDDTPGGSSGNNGSANCFANQITLNEKLLSDPARIRTTAGHEIGHALGLNHTGIDDSFDNRNPYMATCLTASAAAARLFSQDDAGNVTHQRTDLEPEALHPNSSFEQGFSYWGRHTANPDYPPYVAILDDGGAADGIAHLRYRNATAGDYIYQTANYAYSSNTSIDGRINLRHDNYVAGARSGSVYVEILTRKVRYGDGEPCDYATNQNQNVRQSVSAFEVKESRAVTPGSSWAMADTRTHQLIGSSVDKSFDVRIRIRTNVKNADGRYVPVQFDNVRARDCHDNQPGRDCDNR